jgi:hypothetical protein
MADVASKQQTTALFLSTVVIRTIRHRTGTPNGKPVLCLRTFSSVFRAGKLHSLTWGVLGPSHAFPATNLFKKKMRHWLRTSQLQLHASHEALPAPKHGNESPSILKQMSTNHVLLLMTVVE